MVSLHSYRAIGLKGLVVVVILFLLLICPMAWAQTSLELLPNPRQTEGSWIADQAALITPGQEHRLNRRIAQLQARTTAELAIATVPDLIPPTTTRMFALELFNTWKIGDRRQNNGVLLFLTTAPEHRRVEIITGKGLQQILPDAELSLLIQQEIIPPLQQQRYELAIRQGTEAIAQRLEQRLSPTWLSLPPIGFVGGLGIILWAIGYRQAQHFLQTSPQCQVPSRGFDDSTFHQSAGRLAEMSFADLLAHLFNPEAPKPQSLPDKAWGYVWGGGTMLGVAIALSFHSIFLPTAIWGTTALILLRGLIDILAGMLGLCLLMTLLWDKLRDSGWSLLMLPGAIALFGAIIAEAIPLTWFWLTLVILLSNLFVIGFFLLITDDILRIQRPWQYLGDRQQPIQALTPTEIESILSPAEKMAQSMGNLTWQGWRDASLQPPLTKEQVYLVQGKKWQAVLCPQCQSFTINQKIETFEKKIDIINKRKKQKKAKEPKTITLKIQRTTSTCQFCGHTWNKEETIENQRSLGSNNGSDHSPNSYQSNDSQMSTYDDNWHNINYGDSSNQLDFGGGTSDGGGAGDSW